MKIKDLSTMKRFIVFRDSGETSKPVKDFNTLREAEEYLEDICDDYLPGSRAGFWYLEFHDKPILLEIIDWRNQLEPMAVC